jgi:hypothetical protein
MGNTNLASGWTDRLIECLQESVALPIRPGFAENMGNTEACTWKISDVEQQAMMHFGRCLAVCANGVC